MGLPFAAKARHGAKHCANQGAEDLVDTHRVELVRAARGGEGQAFAELVRPDLPAMLRLAWSITQSEADAEDAVQDALTKLYRSLKSFDESRPLTPWFARIVTNCAHNVRRTRERSRRRDDRAVSVHVEESRPIVEDEALRHTDNEALRQALFLLGPGDREIVGLRHLIGLTERETAEALQIPTGTVKSRTARALVRLRTVIEGTVDQSEPNTENPAQRKFAHD